MALKSGLFMPTVTGRTQGIAEMAASHVPYDSLSDAEVMLRAGTDDNAAYEYLVTKYHRPMIAFMYRMCHNQALAEELAQEVFLRVYRSRKTYAAEAKFTTWLYRIATNLAVNHARDHKVERSGKVVSLDEPDEEYRHDDGCCRSYAECGTKHSAPGAAPGHQKTCDGAAGKTARRRVDA